MTPTTPPPLPTDDTISAVAKPPTVTRPPPPERKFPCVQCGARLQFDATSQALVCRHCGHTEAITPSAAEVQERNWEQYWDSHTGEETIIAGRSSEVKCNVCGAIVLLEDKVAASKCPYCASFLENQPEAAHSMIPPGSVLPFSIPLREARAAFHQWIASRWFAPSSLYRLANLGQLSGTYGPFWTFDAMTYSQYTGARGDNFVITETYTDRDQNGQMITRTRQVVQTRWTPVSGEVRHFFDDVLVYSAHSLPPSHVGNLPPWELQKLQGYKDEFLSGFLTERYTLGLREGFDQAREIMDAEIRRLCMRDIGGDLQRLDSVHTQHIGITFKHVLLPIWVAAYRYHDQLHRILVNGRTGKVVGSRPYSWIKIALLVLTILLVGASLVWLFNR